MRSHHTPGPWSVHARDDRWPQVSDFLGYEIVGPPEAMRGQFERLADAYLIAAAPDLYNELYHLVAMLEPLERDGRLDVPGLATLNAARAALQKAEHGG